VKLSNEFLTAWGGAPQSGLRFAFSVRELVVPTRQLAGLAEQPGRYGTLMQRASYRAAPLAGAAKICPSISALGRLNAFPQ